jgi:hypothetical protein
MARKRKAAFDDESSGPSMACLAVPLKNEDLETAYNGYETYELPIGGPSGLITVPQPQASSSSQAVLPSHEVDKKPTKRVKKEKAPAEEKRLARNRTSCPKVSLCLFRTQSVLY